MTELTLDNYFFVGTGANVDEEDSSTPARLPVSHGKAVARMMRTTNQDGSNQEQEQTFVVIYITVKIKLAIIIDFDSFLTIFNRHY